MTLHPPVTAAAGAPRRLTSLAVLLCFLSIVERSATADPGAPASPQPAPTAAPGPAPPDAPAPGATRDQPAGGDAVGGSSPPAGAAPATPGEAAEKTGSQAVDVTVRGLPSRSRHLRGSAEAVTVVETRRAQQQTGDLGDVLGMAEGVSVRRTGGLGSFARFSLNGLQDEQVRFFLDEVPLDVAGSAFGIAKVPVHLVERVEIYRGVLPLRFGADALGGGINLVTDQRFDTRASVSFQRGSFGTSRLSWLARYRHAPTGLFVGTTGWYDTARNDYDVEVDIADKTGRVRPTVVTRLHDGYQGHGGSLELGLKDHARARLLLFRLYVSAFGKELQHNAIMTIPYGEARYGETVLGATARYEQPLSEGLSLSLVAGAAHRTIHFLDVSERVYDWYGRPVALRASPGETQDTAHDLTLWQRSLFGRAQLEWRPLPQHALRFASTARHFMRNGHERAFLVEGKLDPAAGRKEISSVVTGLEYELHAIRVRRRSRRPPAHRPPGPAEVSRDHRLENVAFAKHYFFGAFAGQPIAIDTPGLSVDRHQIGVGDGVRLRITESLLAKASYEWATRFPSMDEIYGDGALFAPNRELEPESSHNANIGLRLDLRRAEIGGVASEITGFLRETDRLIVPLTTAIGGISQHQNVGRARSLGASGSLAWVSPGGWVALDGNATWQDVRNTATEGTFGAYEGDRIPNRPWLFASWSGRVQWRSALMDDDELSPFYLGRYTHEFFRTWESIGDPQLKARVPSQTVHSVGLSYTVRLPARLVTTLEVDNLLDAKLYDTFGAQRPGRAFAVKIIADL